MRLQSRLAQDFEEFVERGGDLPEHRGVARCPGQRLVGERDQARGAEAGGDALEAGAGDQPIGVATRAAEQVELAGGALDEGGFELGHQRAVIADGGGERGAEGSGIVDHVHVMGRTALTGRFISAPK